MLKIGVVGCGKIAQVRHIPEYAANQNARLVGFFNPSIHRAEEMAAKYGGKVYATAEELFADPEIDAVSVCAANYAHAELTIQALRAGKHVLCEKPMAITLEDCEHMLCEAEKAGKRLLKRASAGRCHRKGHHVPHRLRSRRSRNLVGQSRKGDMVLR